MTFKERAAKTYNSMMLFADQIGKKDLFTQSAALSYYCALSLAPLLVLLVSATSFLGEESKQTLIEQVNLVLGSNASEFINSIIQSTTGQQHLTSISSIVSFLALFISASSVFSQLKSTITSIFSQEDPCNAPVPDEGWMSFFKQRLFSIGMMVSFIFLTLVSLVFSVVIGFILPAGESFFAQLLNQLISFAIYSGVFFLIFRYVPLNRVNKKDSLIGGMTSALFFILGRGLISYYLGSAAISSAYGAAGSLIVLLVWVYYSSFIVFSAAIVTSLLPRFRKTFNQGMNNEDQTKK